MIGQRDELDARLRSLTAERARPSPLRPPGQPRSGEPVEDLLQQVIDILAHELLTADQLDTEEPRA